MPLSEAAQRAIDAAAQRAKQQRDRERAITNDVEQLLADLRPMDDPDATPVHLYIMPDDDETQRGIDLDRGTR